MPIYVNEELGQFHLQSSGSSYIFIVLRNGMLGHLYYGKKVRHREDFSHLLQVAHEPVGNATFVYEGDQTFSLEVIKQEYPVYGTTDYREPAIHLWQGDGSRVCRFVYQGYELTAGKPVLDGLPATYVESEDEAMTLCVRLVDTALGLELDLLYTVYAEEAVITRSARLRNNGSEAVQVDRMLSAVVDFPTADFEMVQLDGAWIRERHVHLRRLVHGVQFIDSKRGASSSQHNPFVALKRLDATEQAGDVYGFSLVYSGNFVAGVEVDHYETARVYMGVNPFDFRWHLGVGETFRTPEVVMVYSDCGLNGMSQTYHRLYRTRLARGMWRDRVRPVKINNWEATYFAFDEAKLQDIATVAKELGVELFVLDDGWFVGRHDDTTSLGDWEVDRTKLPSGLDGLANRLREKGLQFGLWLEPEMISEKSNLYRQHPEWVLQVPGRGRSHGRNQYVLDLSRPEVVDHLYDKLSGVLRSAEIAYVKWDMNRNLTEIGSREWPPERQGEVAHRYMLGLYQLLERLTAAFPQILFESCASGGNRFDPGMLYYMPQTWASDNTDAMERLKIQYGTSMVYPLSAIGAHVSSVPNHQTGRVTPLGTRFYVAMFGVLGFELDATKLSAEELEMVREQIAFYKENRELLQQGTFYRLASPLEQNDAAWMVVSDDQREAMVGFYRKMAEPNPSYARLKLAGLREDVRYQIDGESYYGDELMNIGVMLPPFYTGTVMTERTWFVGDYQAHVWKLVAVQESGAQP